MLRQFLTWWFDQLLELVPARWRQRPGAWADALVLQLLPVAPGRRPEAALVRLRRGQAEDLGTVAVDAGALVLPRQGKRETLVLRAPPGSLLERSVTLPLAAERDPAGVLRFELDRLSPFTAEEVYWTWQQVRRNPERGEVQLSIALLPKVQVAPALETLRRTGAGPVMLEAACADGGFRAFATAEDDTPGLRPWRRRLATGGAAVCAVLALLAMALPFAVQAWNAASLQAQLDALRPQMAEVDGLRRRIAGTGGPGNIIAAEQVRIGDVLATLATLTEVLPDDTHLTSLAMRQRRLDMIGQSAAAARLIGLLAASPQLRNAAFVAPVTRAEDASDLFAIRVETVP